MFQIQVGMYQHVTIAYNALEMKETTQVGIFADIKSVSQGPHLTGRAFSTDTPDWMSKKGGITQETHLIG